MEAKAWRRIGGKVICHLCWHLCKLKEGEFGKCRSRFVKDGKLYTLTYGNISSVESRPMEIKPFFHFLPGKTAITFSTYSCNLDCPWCQNWHISKRSPPSSYRFINPEELLDIAYNDVATCASFNEPTLLFEYLLDLFILARSRGLYNTIVSNGYMTTLALKEMFQAGLDAMNVDLKGDEEVYRRYCGGKAKDVLKTMKKARDLGIHLEVVNLLVTDVNDDESCIEWIVENHLKYVGCEVPLHFTRYFPAYKFEKPPTSIEIIERAIEFAKREGIEFVYVGNVPGHRYENTYCPKCGELLIKRYSYKVLDNRMRGDRCWKCNEKIYGKFV